MMKREEREREKEQERVVVDWIGALRFVCMVVGWQRDKALCITNVILIL